ncbi:Di-copper centre-containing protein [Russula emetica]|nr:Di-copper centre-containing protein [Russula emetica]
MFVHRILSVALAIVWSALGVFCFYDPCPCTKPAVRKEWRTFSTEQKAEWIGAINCLSKLPHDPALTPSVDPSVSLIPPVNKSSSYFDDIVYIHMDLNTRIHFTGQFFPWHRWYVHVFEESLKNKCNYTGVSPYWDWTIDAPNFYESSFWKDSDPKSGLGGWGDPNADYRTPDGGFHTLPLSYPSPHTVRRNFTLVLPPAPVAPTGPATDNNASISASVIEAVLDISPGDYKQFQTVVEVPGGPHIAVHAIMGGDMAGFCPKNAPLNCTQGPKWASNDPLFFLHHAMIDKIWYEWQNRNPASATSFFGGSVERLDTEADYQQYPNGGPPYLSLESTIPADGLFPEVTIGDVLNTTGGYLCYVYE